MSGLTRKFACVFAMSLAMFVCAIHAETVVEIDRISRVNATPVRKGGLRWRTARDGMAPTGAATPSMEANVVKEAVTNGADISKTSSRQSCPPGYWYSFSYGYCFNLNGPCWQYDGTDSGTCMTGNDNVFCQWDEDKQWCDAFCLSDQWYSSEFGKCFDLDANCWQYDNTNAETCTNGNDYMLCQWSPDQGWCDPL